MSEQREIVYTDRYAVRVWLPLIIGIGMTIGGLLSEPIGKSRLLFGVFALLWSGYEFYRRTKGSVS